MAQAFARRIASADIEITGAGIVAGQSDPKAMAVMAEIGMDISDQPLLKLMDIDTTAIDLVVALDEDAARSCLILPGAPAVIRWDINMPAINTLNERLDDYRKMRDVLADRVENLFAGGYLATIVTMKHHSETVLDYFSEGIIVHDTKRIIIWFNQAAEKITGYSRREVIGRDCHDVFTDGLCSGKCSFCDDGVPNFDRIHYPLNIMTREGRQIRAEMTVIALHDDIGVFQGVLACFRDVTEVTHLRQRLKTTQSFYGIIGSDTKMQAIYEHIRDLSASDCSVLIQGESGTGKELVSGAIHGESRRAGRPFVTVNCGALPEGILESELFGHVRGAFTGAVRDKKGRFELAHTGTIFLDEVAELSPNMQVKLLRVLQEGVFERVGGEKSLRVDVRVISATNKDLRDMVQKGQFREDLFYRLCVVPITVPPLRQRRNDIALLVSHFLERFNKEQERTIESISSDALNCMMDYKWPGNVRELQNAIQYAFVKCKGDTILMEHLPPEITSLPTGPRKNSRKKLDFELVQRALQKTSGNKKKAAQMLGVGRATLHRFLRDNP